MFHDVAKKVIKDSLAKEPQHPDEFLQLSLQLSRGLASGNDWLVCKVLDVWPSARKYVTRSADNKTGIADQTGLDDLLATVVTNSLVQELQAQRS